MYASVRLFVFATLSVSIASSFSIPDTFHLVQTTASTVSHQTAAASHQVPHFGADILSVYKQALTDHPLATKMATGATLAVAGDAIAQAQDKDSAYDKRRAASFAVFDSAYRALQHVSFPVIVQYCQGQFLAGALAALPLLHDHLDKSYAAAMEQTLASQLGIVPFLYYPAFFALTGAIQGLDVDGAVARAKENFLPLMKRNLLFWIPVQFVQFGFIQEDLQIPFLSACGLAWTFILSVSAGSAKKYSADEVSSEELLAAAAAQAVFDEAEAMQDTRQRELAEQQV